MDSERLPDTWKRPSEDSLSVRNDGGDFEGFGDCKACGAQVLVRDLNPEAAARFEAGLAGCGRDRSNDTVDQVKRRMLATRPMMQSAPEPWQIAERSALDTLAPRMHARLTDEKALAYLAARSIPVEIAEANGVGYIPANARLGGGTGLGTKWRDRLVFPLSSPGGGGYIGRSLHLWQAGMDETDHKRLLDAELRDPADIKAFGRRWEKTFPAGWYGFDGMAPSVVMVEGAFDRLALIAAGLPAESVVALAGVAASEDWLPERVKSVVIALDGDEAGRQRAEELRKRLSHCFPWPHVHLCEVPADGAGKDWAERWRLAQWDGVVAVFDAVDTAVVSR